MRLKDGILEGAAAACSVPAAASGLATGAAALLSFAERERANGCACGTLAGGGAARDSAADGAGTGGFTESVAVGGFITAHRESAWPRVAGAAAPMRAMGISHRLTPPRCTPAPPPHTSLKADMASKLGVIVMATCS